MVPIAPEASACSIGLATRGIPFNLRRFFLGKPLDPPLAQIIAIIFDFSIIFIVFIKFYVIVILPFQYDFNYLQYCLS
jgi:hypothetical protein